MPEVEKLIDCPKPCTMFKMQPRMVLYAATDTNAADLDIRFPEKTTISTDQYSYTWLNLVAGVGGYVGLFLGYSVYQMTDLVDIFLQLSWVEYREYLKKVFQNIGKTPRSRASRMPVQM